MHPGLIKLRVKLKSLAQEARFIREEESRIGRVKGPWYIRGSLIDHRCKVVARESRDTHIAYAFIKGKPYAKVEDRPKWRRERPFIDPPIAKRPNWNSIAKMVWRYGDLNMSLEETKKELQAWTEADPAPSQVVLRPSALLSPEQYIAYRRVPSHLVDIAFVLLLDGDAQAATEKGFNFNPLTLKHRKGRTIAEHYYESSFAQLFLDQYLQYSNRWKAKNLPKLKTKDAA